MFKSIRNQFIFMNSALVIFAIVVSMSVSYYLISSGQDLRESKKTLLEYAKELEMKNQELNDGFSDRTSKPKAYDTTDDQELVLSITMTLGVAELDQTLGIDASIKKADEALYKGNISPRIMSSVSGSVEVQNEICNKVSFDFNGDRKPEKCIEC